MPECRADEYEELARQLHDAIAEGQTVEDTAKMLRLLASEPVPATGLRWIGSGVSVSRQLAGEPVPATPACICGRAVPVAGTCFDIDGAYWSGHDDHPQHA